MPFKLVVLALKVIVNGLLWAIGYNLSDHAFQYVKAKFTWEKALTFFLVIILIGSIYVIVDSMYLGWAIGKALIQAWSVLLSG